MTGKNELTAKQLDDQARKKEESIERARLARSRSRVKTSFSKKGIKHSRAAAVAAKSSLSSSSEPTTPTYKASGTPSNIEADLAILSERKLVKIIHQHFSEVHAKIATETAEAVDCLAKLETKKKEYSATLSAGGKNRNTSEYKYTLTQMDKLNFELRRKKEHIRQKETETKELYSQYKLKFSQMQKTKQQEHAKAVKSAVKEEIFPVDGVRQEQVAKNNQYNAVKEFSDKAIVSKVSKQLENGKTNVTGHEVDRESTKKVDAKSTITKQNDTKYLPSQDEITTSSSSHTKNPTPLPQAKLSYTKINATEEIMQEQLISEKTLMEQAQVHAAEAKLSYTKINATEEIMREQRISEKSLMEQAQVHADEAEQDGILEENALRAQLAEKNAFKMKGKLKWLSGSFDTEDDAFSLTSFSIGDGESTQLDDNSCTLSLSEAEMRLISYLRSETDAMISPEEEDCCSVSVAVQELSESVLAAERAAKEMEDVVSVASSSIGTEVSQEMVWYAYWSEEHEKEYYYQPSTGDVQWVMPNNYTNMSLSRTAPIPEEEEEIVEEETTTDLDSSRQHVVEQHWSSDDFVPENNSVSSGRARRVFEERKKRRRRKRFIRRLLRVTAGIVVVGTVVYFKLPGKQGEVELPEQLDVGEDVFVGVQKHELDEDMRLLNKNPINEDDLLDLRIEIPVEEAESTLEYDSNEDEWENLGMVDDEIIQNTSPEMSELINNDFLPVINSPPDVQHSEVEGELTQSEDNSIFIEGKGNHTHGVVDVLSDEGRNTQESSEDEELLGHDDAEIGISDNIVFQADPKNGMILIEDETPTDDNDAKSESKDEAINTLVDVKDFETENSFDVLLSVDESYHESSDVFHEEIASTYEAVLDNIVSEEIYFDAETEIRDNVGSNPESNDDKVSAYEIPTDVDGAKSESKDEEVNNFIERTYFDTEDTVDVFLNVDEISVESSDLSPEETVLDDEVIPIESFVTISEEIYFDAEMESLDKIGVLPESEIPTDASDAKSDSIYEEVSILIEEQDFDTHAMVAILMNVDANPQESYEDAPQIPALDYEWTSIGSIEHVSEAKEGNISTEDEIPTCGKSFESESIDEDVDILIEGTYFDAPDGVGIPVNDYKNTQESSNDTSPEPVMDEGVSFGYVSEELYVSADDQREGIVSIQAELGNGKISTVGEISAHARNAESESIDEIEHIGIGELSVSVEVSSDTAEDVDHVFELSEATALLPQASKNNSLTKKPFQTQCDVPMVAIFIPKCRQNRRQLNQKRRPGICFIPLMSHIVPRCRRAANAKPIFDVDAFVASAMME